MNKLTWTGFAFSLIWILSFLILAYDKHATLTPNEWGDFLSGLTAPLALLWLIIGFFQQSNELKLNTDALRLQQEELRHQVEATRHLAEHSNRQADASEKLEELARLDHEREAQKEIREAQPEFIPNGGNSGKSHVHAIIKNIGSDVYDVELNHKHLPGIDITPSDTWKKNQQIKLSINKDDCPLQYPIWFSLSYTDKLKSRRTKEYQFTKEYEFREI